MLQNSTIHKFVIKRAKNQARTMQMLTLATENEKELKHLPVDLRTRANEILYTKQGIKLADNLV